MDIIGLDLHKRESQLAIKAEDGTIAERRIVTSRERFTAVLGGRPRARIILEASTESEWMARHLESLGHEVIVADPNYAPMYANRPRRTKTDKRDARTLLDACEANAYPLGPAGVPAVAARHHLTGRATRADLGLRCRAWAPQAPVAEAPARSRAPCVPTDRRAPPFPRCSARGETGVPPRRSARGGARRDGQPRWTNSRSTARRTVSLRAALS
jgi:hypothetical protein